MNRLVVCAGSVLLLGIAFISPMFAAAQSCTTVTRTLSYGMRGAEVTALQEFLVSQQYPGSGPWMVTGYFGSATRAAVQNFQRAQGLSPVGIVGPQTQAALQRVSCGVQSGYSYGVYTQPYQSAYPYTTPYTYQYQAGYTQPVPPTYPTVTYTTPTIVGLSAYSGNVGDTVTVYGSGFSTERNTVHFGNGVITNLRSQDGTTLSFAVPSQLTGFGSETVTLSTYQVSVSNMAGYTSQTVPFTVTGYTLQGSAPTISSATGPNTLARNTSGTWTLTVQSQPGTMLTTDVTWGDEYLYPYAAQHATQQLYGLNSQTVSFSHTYTQAGTYTVTFRVRNTSGREALSTMTVVVSDTATGSLTLNSLSPQQAQKGTLLTLTGNNFHPTDNAVHFGVGGLQHVPSFNNGTTIYYTVPQYISSCDFVVGACGAPITQVQAGTYPVYVVSQNGTSQTLNFYVQ